MEYFIAFLVGTVAGVFVAKIVYFKQFAELLNDLGVTDDELASLQDQVKGKQAEVPSIDVKVEKHGDQLYAYQVDNDKFLGQAADPTALINRIAESLPSEVRLNISKENGSAYIESLVEETPAK